MMEEDKGMCYGVLFIFFFQAEDGIRDSVASRGLGPEPAGVHAQALSEDFIPLTRGFASRG